MISHNHSGFARVFIGIGCTVVLSSCGWQGASALPLPGAPGRVSAAQQMVVEMANVGSLVSNSPVLVDDVVVGSVGDITVKNWHAVVEVLIRPEVKVPANAVATVGQTSLLGSSHLALNPPLGESPAGQLASGSVISLNDTSTYPSTEQTLAAVSVVVNGGGLGQIGDIVHSFNAAFNGRQQDFRDLIGRLDTFVGTFDSQREDVVDLISGLNRLAVVFADQRAVLTDALTELPEAMNVLLRERPRLIAALDKLAIFSGTATAVINNVQSDLVTNLRHLEPVLRSLADVGADIDKAIAFATVFPYGQSVIDHAVRGDYINQITTLDFTVPRLKKELLMGTRWGDPQAQLQAAVGDPGYAEQTGDPLAVGLAPSPAPTGPVSPSDPVTAPPVAGQAPR